MRTMHMRAIIYLAVIISSITLLGDDTILPDASLLLGRAVTSEGNQARLQMFFKKATGGGRITLGVIGGSITEGAACAKADKRYHGVVLDWCKAKFPKAQFSLVNAGIGATGSNYGAMRVGRDLLSKSPDLVILEYAVNDGNTKELAESYEGVVRQILNSSSHPALILLFMMRKEGQNAQEWQSKVGDRYALPMLSYRDALWPEIQAGRLKWEQISPDSVHPNEAGHSFTGRLICAFLEKSLDVQPAKEQLLPEPLISNLYEHCQLFDGEDLKPVSNQGWEFDGANKRSAGWKSATPGSSIEFEIEGESIFISYWRINGPMGKASVSVDRATPAKFDAWFDQTWGGYRQMQQIASGLSSGKHHVKVDLLGEKNAKSSGNEFRILCLGGAGVDRKAAIIGK